MKLKNEFLNYQKDKTLARFTFLSIALTLIYWLWLFYNLRIGFKTLVDEAFFVLGLNPKQDLGIQHTQFFTITRFFFEKFSLPVTIYNSRLTNYCVAFASLLTFGISSYYWLCKKKYLCQQFLLYMSIVFLWGAMTLSVYEYSFAFNGLQVFIVSLIVSCYLIFDSVDNVFIKSLSVFTLGFFSFFGIINILPSGLLFLLLITCLILLKNIKSYQWLFLLLVQLVVGFALALFIFDKAFFPIKKVYENLFYTILHPSFGTGGYTISSFLVLLYEYAKMLIVMILSGMGLFGLYHFIKVNTKKEQVAGFIFFLVAVIFIVFERRFFHQNMFLFPIIMVVMMHISQLKPIDWNKSVYRILQLIAFWGFPIVAIQGTNVFISHKICFFIFLWVFLLFQFLFKKNTISIAYRNMCILLTIFLGFYVNILANSDYNVYKGNIFNSKTTIPDQVVYSKIKLTERQIAYFERVDSILKVNSFNVAQHKILVIDYDYSVILFLNTTNYGGLFHHINHMDSYAHVFNSIENRPDCILLPQDDINEFIAMVEKYGWNFPEAYLQYEIGNSESSARNVSDRCLFYLKGNDVE